MFACWHTSLQVKICNLNNWSVTNQIEYTGFRQGSYLEYICRLFYHKGQTLKSITTAVSFNTALFVNMELLYHLTWIEWYQVSCILKANLKCILSYYVPVQTIVSPYDANCVTPFIYPTTDLDFLFGIIVSFDLSFYFLKPAHNLFVNGIFPSL